MRTPDEPVGSANDRLKSRFGSWFWSSMIAATLVHLGTFAFWPPLTAEDVSIKSGELVTIELPPPIEIPSPPEPLPRPATPVTTTAEIDETLTIPVTTFDRNPIGALPPPPEERATALTARPRFTPFTGGPEILNRAEVQREMARLYPPMLRDVGIGGTVEMFFYLDENGAVQQTQINKSSGHTALDDAALAVSEVFRFSPALNRDKNVPVWVSFPIVFQVRDKDEAP